MDRKDVVCRILLRKSGVSPSPEDVIACSEILSQLESGELDRMSALSKLAELDINASLADRIVSVYFRSRKIRHGGRRSGRAYQKESLQ
ncbi:MAG: hypothetical protein DRO39_05025 [Thermoprotei archaeon]|nr:MAG: hypothetical protein DRO39_05025 [Thermoprotei archaeon]